MFSIWRRDRYDEPLTPISRRLPRESWIEISNERRNTISLPLLRSIRVDDTPCIDVSETSSVISAISGQSYSIPFVRFHSRAFVFHGISSFSRSSNFGRYDRVSYRYWRNKNKIDQVIIQKEKIFFSVFTIGTDIFPRQLFIPRSEKRFYKIILIIVEISNYTYPIT